MTSRNYRYSLDNTSKKFDCPSCLCKKRFVRYVDTELNCYMDKKYGRCDREVKCGYFLKPNSELKPLSNKYENKLKAPVSFHTQKDMRATLGIENNLTCYLSQRLGPENLKKIQAKYSIGTYTGKKYDGTIFWNVDQFKRIRSGKIIYYNRNGRRTKYANYFHSKQLKGKMIKSFNLEQCFFGLHLISKNKKPVAIVESEKTACIMSIIMDDFNWLATGSLSHLVYKKILPLRDRKITLFPDLGKVEVKTPFKKWEEKAERYRSEGFDIEVSDVIEKIATDEEKEKGLDIADYFLDELNT